ILAVGDSYTYGHGVPADESLPAMLQRALSDRSLGTAIEVVNLGRPGFNLLADYCTIIQARKLFTYHSIVLLLSSDDASPFTRRELIELGLHAGRFRAPQWIDSKWIGVAGEIIRRLYSEEQILGRALSVCFYE